MCGSAEEYPAKADRTTAGVSSEARAVIDASKPYPGGNDALYLLHQMDLEDKHRLLLALAGGADQGLVIGPPSAPRDDGSVIQPLQMLSRAMSKHLYPLQEGSMLIRTDAAEPDILSLHTFFLHRDPA